MTWWQTIGFAVLIIFLAIVITTFVLSVFFVMPVHGHEAPSGWAYPEACCGGKDCRPVPCAEITMKGREYAWHGMWTHPAEFGFGKYPSPDNQCHVCVSSDTKWEPFIRCIYVPVRTS